MARNVTSEGGGATPWLAFLIGGLLVVVAVIAWFVFSGGQVPTDGGTNINVDMPSPNIEVPEVNIPTVKVD